jgi:hypothetical protein
VPGFIISEFPFRSGEFLQNRPIVVAEPDMFAIETDSTVVRFENGIGMDCPQQNQYFLFGQVEFQQVNDVATPACFG